MKKFQKNYAKIGTTRLESTYKNLKNRLLWPLVSSINLIVTVIKRCETLTARHRSVCVHSAHLKVLARRITKIDHRHFAFAFVCLDVTCNGMTSLDIITEYVCDVIVERRPSQDQRNVTFGDSCVDSGTDVSHSTSHI